MRGWVRAGTLVGLFDPRDASGKPLPVTPLASALNLEVHRGLVSSQTAELADALRTTAGPVLIAWTHHQIVEVISHLAGVNPAPPGKWPDDRYDVVYVLTRDGGGWQFAQVPQMVLAGDRPTPI